MRRSILGHVIPLITQAEPAATRALRHILEASEIAERFVELVGAAPFAIGRIGSEWNYAERVRPDIAIHDAQDGYVRVFVENKFRAELTDHQPVEYLRALPCRATSVLAFIAPEDRIHSMWGELKERCQRAKLDFVEESTTADPRRARVGVRTLLLTSWGRVLEALQHAAAAGGHAAIEQDVVQLRGLTEETRAEASLGEPPDDPAGVSFAAPDATFPPLRADEPTDVGTASRLLNYCGLIDAITRRLTPDVSWDTKGMHASGFGRYLHVRGRFVLYLCVSFTAWRDYGITPLWCRYLGTENRQREIREFFLGARVDDAGNLNIPIRLKTGVERRRVVDHAAEQMRKIADRLLQVNVEDRHRPDIMELIANAPWREAVTFRETWPHEYVVINKDAQQELLAAFCERISRGEGIECQFFHQRRNYLFLGDYKYWTMTECDDIDLDAGDEVLNRALLYRDRRDFVIRQGDTGKRVEEDDNDATEHGA